MIVIPAINTKKKKNTNAKRKQRLINRVLKYKRAMAIVAGMELPIESTKQSPSDIKKPATVSNKNNNAVSSSPNPQTVHSTSFFSQTSNDVGNSNRSIWVNPSSTNLDSNLNNDGLGSASINSFNTSTNANVSFWNPVSSATTHTWDNNRTREFHSKNLIPSIPLNVSGGWGTPISSNTGGWGNNSSMINTNVNLFDNPFEKTSQKHSSGNNDLKITAKPADEEVSTSDVADTNILIDEQNVTETNTNMELDSQLMCSKTSIIKKPPIRSSEKFSYGGFFSQKDTTAIITSPCRNVVAT